MGAFRWSEPQNPLPHNFIWEMKKFSPDFHAPIIQNQNPGLKEEGKGSKQGDKKTEQNEEDRARCEWNFTLSAVVSSSSTGTTTDTLGVIEFDPSDRFIATGGIARKIRLYNLSCVLPNTAFHGEVRLLDHASACDYYICTPAKLSSLRWKPGSNGRVLGSGDYDGVVMEYDVERKIPVFERDEHGGRRVWSVDYSHLDPVVGASGSDDGTVQMWDPRCDGGENIATVRPSRTSSPVCCVEFNPYGDTLVAVGCADRKAYGYDIRRMSDPVLQFDGHRKTVTYVRFLDAHTMVTSATDGCLKLWNVNDSRLIRAYTGHVNDRHFVGLSVWRNGGLLGCGSENNKVFVYDKRWGDPIWVHGFDSLGEHGFVSSVGWRQSGEEQCTLVAGGSDGVLQVFVGTKSSVSL
ncbi:hypothetical protein L6164_006085 [Bauhinia variegata]|uniref:Uncharacterized protein n=1 Tax=Bauhinia variegata TaxID=167791 RepID=A0ACB9PSU4_BAUVA|nr:hypothetical protein L6164_006085 [Bauhinia variegata]